MNDNFPSGHYLVACISSDKVEHLQIVRGRREAFLHAARWSSLYEAVARVLQCWNWKTIQKFPARR